ncbi:MAG: LamG-like jellyroll fold domain-containing protein [Pseudomonadota bacterium]
MKTVLSGIIFAILAAIAAPLSAQYQPDVLELDGATTLVFPAHETLDLSGGATIEFWVQPDWESAPGFDPVILSYAGEQGASYLVAMLRDRDGIGIMSGDTFMVAPFDFTDGEMHFVAIIDYGDRTEVLVNNTLVAVLDMTIQSLPADGLFIGTADGTNDPFLGGIAAVRLWGIPLSQDVLLQHAMRDLLDEERAQHPDLRFLIAHSAFGTEDFRLAAANADPQ